MSNKRDKKSEELEQTLTKQLELLKTESEEWLKIGAVVAVGALLTYGIFKATRSNKEKATTKALELLEREGLLNEEIKTRLTKPNKSSFWPNMTQRLVILGLALAKDRVFHEVFSTPTEGHEIEEGK